MNGRRNRGEPFHIAISICGSEDPISQCDKRCQQRNSGQAELHFGSVFKAKRVTARTLRTYRWGFQSILY